MSPAAFDAGTTPQDVIAEPPSGPVRGRLVDGVATFLGVPYAAPPVGDLRFRAPEPLAAWSEAIDATAPGPAPPQGRSALETLLGPDPAVQSEDCLTVNVYRPGTEGETLPVLVWVHGGAFRTGRSGGPRQAAQWLARQGPMVVVTMNYRLGSLGYLYLAEIADGFGAGNFGLLDQHAALAWVTENVAAFGGDPQRIMIGGHSAGAVSAVALAKAPPPGTRIHRVIAQSAALVDLASPAQATEHARKHLDRLGIGVGELDRLRHVPASVLLDASAALPGPAQTTPLLVVGGAGLPHAPLDPQGGPVPGLFAGTTREEARAFLPAGADPAKVSELTQAFFEEPLDRLAGLAGTAHRYRFDWCAPDEDNRFGVCHGIDVPFLFGTARAWADAPALAGATADEVNAVRTAFGSAVARFVVSGDPGWQPWTTESPVSHRFGSGR